MTEDVVISTRDLTRHFRVGGGFLGGPARVVRAVDGVTLDIRARETFALVGESGCGKTTLGRVMLRLQEPTSGTVAYRGTDLTGLDEGAMNALRKKLQIVFQDPYASLNPRMRVGEILAEPLRSHGFGSSAEIRERSAELLEMVGLRRQYLRNYPHQFSGGQRQRIGIARALANGPDFVVCDESVSALDVSIQAQVLNLLADLQDQLKLTYLFITHDLAVVRQFADRVGVMFLGQLVEVGRTEELFAAPLHPYTMLLMEAVPRPDPHQRGRDRPILTGEIPSPMNLPPGCRFHTRCPFARDICRVEDPALQERGGRTVACHFPLNG
ncbi:peptide/nickel transport system ATP-binding protein [Defluviimonas denitrificans]|jgi:oligopeptide/dipeptide ABC transporter ATP-binding protein|uniref:Peptide/nickel transport system ATP-binding protein n=1 Tax=Albidovulum denitrificans TaxID=404881 RepID=A0A2S8S8H0_9RHOB|nr:oligopeptide/dipeptide ABC transporter ATP-binding protein [Defluviimonas denitrificans]PQV57086.1 peptide/nickel transport system ATP-binding protein [Defluviimonas denitrificans]